MVNTKCVGGFANFFLLSDLSNSLDSELRKLRETYNKLKKEYDHAKEKLKFFEKVF